MSAYVHFFPSSMRVNAGGAEAALPGVHKGTCRELSFGSSAAPTPPAAEQVAAQGARGAAAKEEAAQPSPLSEHFEGMQLSGRIAASPALGACRSVCGPAPPPTRLCPCLTAWACPELLAGGQDDTGELYASLIKSNMQPLPARGAAPRTPRGAAMGERSNGLTTPANRQPALPPDWHEQRCGSCVLDQMHSILASCARAHCATSTECAVRAGQHLVFWYAEPLQLPLHALCMWGRLPQGCTSAAHL